MIECLLTVQQFYQIDTRLPIPADINDCTASWLCIIFTYKVKILLHEPVFLLTGILLVQYFIYSQSDRRQGGDACTCIRMRPLVFPCPAAGVVWSCERREAKAK